MYSKPTSAQKKQNLAALCSKPLCTPALELGSNGDRSTKTFKPLWRVVSCWHSYFYVTDGYKVYQSFIDDAEHIVDKTYMTRVESENTRLRHYLARNNRKTLCYSKTVDMLKYSIRLLLHYLKYQTVPVLS